MPVSKKTQPKNKEVHGVVVDCRALNIREDASLSSRSIGHVNAGDDLLIDEKYSTDDFWRITSPSGVQGYCMKHYVKIG